MASIMQSSGRTFRSNFITFSTNLVSKQSSRNINQKWRSVFTSSSVSENSHKLRPVFQKEAISENPDPLRPLKGAIFKFFAHVRLVQMGDGLAKTCLKDQIKSQYTSRVKLI